MKTRTYSVSEARKHGAEILDGMEQGEEMASTKYGRWVASITPPGKKKQNASDLLASCTPRGLAHAYDRGLRGRSQRLRELRLD